MRREVRQWKKNECERRVMSCTVYKVQGEHGLIVRQESFVGAENRNRGAA